MRCRLFVPITGMIRAGCASNLPVMGTNNLQRIAAFGKAAALTIDRQTWYEIYTAALGYEVP